MDEDLGRDFKELADVHASKAFQFLQFVPNVTLGLPDKCHMDYPLSVSLGQREYRGGMPHRASHRTGLDSLLVLGRPLKSCSYP